MGRAFELRKGRKMKRWAAMSKTFTRIGKDIVMAIKDGGPDPESNSKLFFFRASKIHLLEEIIPIERYGDNLLVPSIIGSFLSAE